MAPNCPEEIDVFTIPHSRMKELVHKYLNMMSEINFADRSHLTNLLENLVTTFTEFKAHEHIENKYIMKKLKNKLKTLSIRNTSVCNCHSDNKLTDMLELVQDGYKCTQKTDIDRKNFGIKLKKALDEFTENFIPHMEEEEEVFQPMLIKYFTFDELKEIKYKVLEKHFCHSEICRSHRATEKTEFVYSDSSDEEYSEKLEATKDSHVTKKDDQLTIDGHVADKVPDEVVMKIFSYLNPKDLSRCAQVSHRWNNLSLDGSLWKNFLPVQWSKGEWCFTSSVDVEAEEQRLLQMEEHEDTFIIDEDADVDESAEGTDFEQQVKKEAEMLTSMVKYLLPRIGQSVITINLCYSKGLVNGLLYRILSLCPQVENLILTHTQISDLGFKSLGKNGCGRNLKKIDLTGCKYITDVTLDRLSMALCSVQFSIPSEVFHQEKNETEANEKGEKNRTVTQLNCHSACGQDENQNRICNEETMNDIEDNYRRTLPKEAVIRTNQCYNSMNNTLANTKNKTASSVTIVDSLTSLLKPETSICCYQTCSKNSVDITDSQLTDRTKHFCGKCEDGFENVCDILNCGLEFLSLSGCMHITDKGLRSLATNRMFPELQFMDLSGCDKVTSDALTELVSVCTSLDHQYLYYCDNITEDPYFDTASGCQNLECPTRACCRSGC